MMVVAAGAVVVAAALLVSPVVAVILTVVFLGIAVCRAAGLVQDWRRRGTDPFGDGDEG